MKVLKLIQVNKDPLYYQHTVDGTKVKLLVKRSRRFAAMLADADAPTVSKHLESILNIGTVATGYFIAEDA